MEVYGVVVFASGLSEYLRFPLRVIGYDYKSDKDSARYKSS